MCIRTEIHTPCWRHRTPHVSSRGVLLRAQKHLWEMTAPLDFSQQNKTRLCLALFYFYFFHTCTQSAVFPIHHLYSPCPVTNSKHFLSLSFPNNYPTQVWKIQLYVTLFPFNGLIALKYHSDVILMGLLLAEKWDKLIFYSSDNLCCLDVDIQLHLVCIK